MRKLCSVVFLTLMIIVSTVTTKAETVVLEKKLTKIGDFEERPYSSHFFVEDFLEWEFEKDPDAIHNVSKVPLGKRVRGEKVNDYQSEKAKVASLAIMNKNTSGTPSQGSDIKAIYNFTNWQYIDVLVAWAGSAGEGIIVPPSSDVTDVAHLNGVPVLGTVFFPPLAYGGKVDWLDEFLVQDENGGFPVADKLIEMASIYGFDGWFINQETNSANPKHGKLFQEFLSYYNKNKPSNQEIMWYDSMLENGIVSWQNQLNDRNEMFFQKQNQRMSDRLFLNFWWNSNMIKSSAEKAKSLGRDPYDVYSGIDVQAKGPVSRYLPSDLVGEDGELMTSLGLYAPDWSLRDGAKEDIEKYWENEQIFWVNEKGDPRDVSNRNGWEGISRYFVEKSAVTTLPFVTNFNVGHGDNQYKDGLMIKEGTFNNRSRQDLLPTYRWIIDQENNNLKARFAYDKVFTGGSSLKLFGETTEGSDSFVKLYATDLKLGQGNEASLVYTGDADLDLVLKIGAENIVLTSNSKTEVNGWSKVSYDLSDFAGQKVSEVTIKVNAKSTIEDAEIYVGELKITDSKNYSIKSIDNFKILSKKVSDNVSADFRLSWEHDGVNVDHYNLYTKSDGDWNYQGSTKNNAYYINNIERGSLDSVEIKVVAVDLNKKEVDASADVVEFTFDEIELPTGSFDVSKTFVKVGETVELNALPSLSTDSVEFIVNGGKLMNENNNFAEVVFEKSGLYSVEMRLSNRAGTTSVLREKLILVHDEKFDYELKNLSLDVLGENVSVSNSCAPNESGPGALDGSLETKWCDNSSDKPTMEIMFDDVKTITGFEIHHAEAGGENREWNSRHYEILTSLDGENWTQVVHKTENEDAVTVDSIEMIEASYIKLILHRAEQTGNTARIYEFKILGFDETDIKVHPLQEQLHDLRNVYFNFEGSLDDYTEASRSDLMVYLNEAKIILEENSVDINQETIFKLIENIYASAEKLVTKVDAKKMEIGKLIKYLETLDGSLYEEKSYQNLLITIKEAKTLLEAEDVTLEMLEAMMVKLKIVEENLRIFEEKPVITEPEKEKGPNESKPTETEKPEAEDNQQVEDLPTTGSPNYLVKTGIGSVILGASYLVLKKKRG